MGSCYLKGKSANEVQQSALEFGFAIKEGEKRVAHDCRGVEKLTRKLKISLIIRDNYHCSFGTSHPFES